MPRASASRIKAGQAFVEITTDNVNLMKGLQAAQKNITNFGQKLKDLGSDMFILGGFMSMPMAKSLETFAEFDDKMRTLKGVSNASKETMASLREEILDLGATTAFTARQVAEGAIELARIGFEADEVSTALKPTLELVRSTGESIHRLGEFAGYSSSVLKIFKKSAQEFNDVTNIMAFSANKSATSLADYYESMKMAGPYAQMVGESLEGASAALMLMANMGVRGSLAGTSLRNVYQVLAAASGKFTGETEEQNKTLKKSVNYFEELGIKLKDSRGNLIKVSKIMDDLKNKLKSMPKSEKLNFLIDQFGLRGSLGASSMLNDYENYFQDYEKALLKLQKTEKNYKELIAKEQEAGLGGFLRGMKSRLEAMELAFGKGFWKIIEKYKDALLGTTTGILEFIKNNSKLAAKLLFLTGTLFTTGIALYGIGTILKILGGSLGIILGTVSKVTSLLTGTLGLIVSLARGLWQLVGVIDKIAKINFTLSKGLVKTSKLFLHIGKNVTIGTVVPLYHLVIGLSKATMALSAIPVGTAVESFRALSKIFGALAPKVQSFASTSGAGIILFLKTLRDRTPDLTNFKKALLLSGRSFKVFYDFIIGDLLFVQAFWKAINQNIQILTRYSATFRQVKKTLNLGKSLLSSIVVLRKYKIELNKVFAQTKTFGLKAFARSKAFVNTKLTIENLNKVFKNFRASLMATSQKILIFAMNSRVFDFFAVQANHLRKSFQLFKIAMSGFAIEIGAYIKLLAITSYNNIKYLAINKKLVNSFNVFRGVMIRFVGVMSMATSIGLAFGNMGAGLFAAFASMPMIFARSAGGLDYFKVVLQQTLREIIRFKDGFLLIANFTVARFTPAVKSLSGVFDNLRYVIQSAIISFKTLAVWSNISRIATLAWANATKIFAKIRVQYALLSVAIKGFGNSLTKVFTASALTAKLVFVNSLTLAKTAVVKFGAVIGLFTKAISLVPIMILGTKILAVTGIVFAAIYAWYRYNKAISSGVKNYIKQSQGIQKFKRNVIQAFKNIKETAATAFGSIKESLEAGNLSGAIKTAIAGLKLLIHDAFEPFFQAWDDFYDRNQAWIESLRVAAITIASGIARAAMKERHAKEARQDEEYVMSNGKKIKAPRKDELYSFYGPAVFVHSEKTKQGEEYQTWAKIRAENRARREAEAIRFEQDLQKSLNSNLQNDSVAQKSKRDVARAKLLENFNNQINKSHGFAVWKKKLGELIEGFNNNAEQAFLESEYYVHEGRMNINKELSRLDKTPSGIKEIELRTAIKKAVELVNSIKTRFTNYTNDTLKNENDTLSPMELKNIKEMTIEYGQALSLLRQLRERLENTAVESQKAVEEQNSKREAIGAWSFQELQNVMGKSIAERTLEATIAGNKFLNDIKKNTKKKEVTSLGVPYV